MAQFILENYEARVVIDEHASEIHSFTDKDTDNEYMWQGDPAYWAGRNPTLFPMVGATWDKILHINGKEYKTGNHGFTRRSDFTCVEHDEQHCIMELKDSQSTLEEYPFHFTLRIQYVLEGRKLFIYYTITNDNEVDMPFNFGLHPAFNCPTDGGDFEDYYLQLNQNETFDWLDTHLNNENRIELDRDALAKTIIIEDPKSTEASLTNGRHGVTVGFKDYPWIAFWSPNAPFVCIEPWYSHTDFEEVRVPFEQREGTLVLKPHETFETSYSIRIW